MAPPPPKRVVLITGCSTGIGRSLALTYNARDFLVYASARKTADLSTLHSDIHKVALDVTDDASCKAAVDRIIKEQGRIDVLVANAGAGGTGPLLDADVDRFKSVLEVNLYGVMRLVNLVAPLMIERRSGLIIPIGSVVGDCPTAWTGIYNVSKAALHSYADTLAVELLPFDVRVCLVTPGAVTSEFGKKQSASVHLAEGSLFEECRDDIYARANRGQVNAMPTRDFALKVVEASTSSAPPAQLLAGGTSSVWLTWILTWLPRKARRSILYRAAGLAKLAKSTKVAKRK